MAFPLCLASNWIWTTEKRHPTFKDSRLGDGPFVHSPSASHPASFSPSWPMLRTLQWTGRKKNQAALNLTGVPKKSPPSACQNPHTAVQIISSPEPPSRKGSYLSNLYSWKQGIRSSAFFMTLFCALPPKPTWPPKSAWLPLKLALAR